MNEIKDNNMMWSTDPWLNDGGGDGILIQGDNNDISYNHITGSLACSQRYIYDGSAIELIGATNNRIHHNTIAHNFIFAEISEAENNTFAYNVSHDGGFTHHTNSSGTRLYNNVFYVPGGPGIVTCGPCTPDALRIVNNIFVAATGIYGTDPVSEDHNIFFNPDGVPFNSAPISATSRVADPRFVDPASGDFHLLPNSPALNAGSSEPMDDGYTLDMEGSSVPADGQPDIGAYESH
jgi:hypothetical protein